MPSLRLFPRLAHTRSFHSPFVTLNATTRFTAQHPSSAAPIYEKQHDTSPEPHLSSSGTRTYVVSEPDPSNTPYQVPSGAYPASASYLTTPPIPEARTVHHKEAGVGQNAGVRNTAASGGTDAPTGGIGPMDAPSTKPGKL